VRRIILDTSRSDQHASLNNELLDLLGYGLAKFDKSFIREFGFATKSAFYQYFVNLHIAETVYVIKNRQDHFDPFFDNGRKGWWQDYDYYQNRKIAIDHIFGNMNVTQFVVYIKGCLTDKRFTLIQQI